MATVDRKKTENKALREDLVKVSDAKEKLSLQLGTFASPWFTIEQRDLDLARMADEKKKLRAQLLQQKELAEQGKKDF